MSIGGIFSIGFLDRRVTIQVLTSGVDSAGQPTETWTNLVTVWMGFTPSRGQERFTARQVVGTAVVTFEARYRSDITVDKHRLVFDGRNWDISDIRENGRRHTIEIDASARSEG
jgi:SPP1 family predicted phage head-tail adaptor